MIHSCACAVFIILFVSLTRDTGEGLIHAEAMTKLLFDSDYSSLQADHIVEALKNDPRLVLIDENDILRIPLPKLAAKYGLVTSNCMHSLDISFFIPSLTRFLSCSKDLSPSSWSILQQFTRS